MSRIATLSAALLVLAAQADESLFRDAHVAFKYGGKWFSCEQPVSETALPGGAGWTSRRCEYRTPDGLLGVRVTWKFYTDYPAAEYLPELYAVGSNATKIVEKYASFDFRRAYAGTNPREDTATRIRALVGDRCCNFPFVPETHWLGEETTVGFSAVSRSSDGSFYFSALDRSKNWVEPLHDMFWPGDPLKAGYMPYLSFDFPEGDGLDLAIGWSGSWRCDCSKYKGLTTLKAGLVDAHFRVLPGETLRTPSIVLMRRAPGVSPRAFRTVKHRFIRAFKSPRDASGSLFKPLMPLTSDGGMKTDQMMVDIIKWAKDNNLGRDGFWIDAGWNGYATDVDPMKWTHWRKYHGSWTPNRVSHPDGDFKRVSAAAHDAGMKFILWCEPERVLPDSDLGKSLPPEALLSWTGSTDGFKVLNLGDPRGRDAAVDTLSRLISGSNVDVYRQDCNMRLFVKYWEEHDAPDRRGVTEMKYIAGLYEFWDRLRAKYPNLLIDNCASGGRRLDIELNSRSHCYCRSDFFISYRGEDQILCAQNTTLNTLDIQPFQGSESTPGKFGDEYGFFSATGPGLVLTPGMRGYYTKEGIAPANLAWLQKMLSVCDRMRTYFQGDFYPQTEPTGLDRDVWCAYQMHRADLDAGFVMAFRRQEAPNDTLAVDLGGIDPNATYALQNWDGADLGTVSGGVLKTRPVKVAKKRDFALLFYRKVAAK